jgi:MarR family transcriptional regulator for hemolysin
VLDRLVRAGLVERRVAAHDRRANTVHLTEPGRRRLAEAEVELEALREALLGGLPEADLERAIDLFSRIAARARGL